MMSETMFTALISLFWLAELVFGAVVVYWFVRQGFAGEGTADDEQFPLEDWELTRQSLAVWGAFFLAIVLMIVLGA